MKQKSIDRKHLYRYFAGRATILEQAEIEQWLKNGENYEEFFDALCEWEISNPQYQSNLIVGYEDFQRKVEENNNRADSLNPGSAWKQRGWLLLIASVLMVLIVGYLMRDQIMYRHVNTHFAETKTVTLYDDSKIVLNANSSIKIPRFIQWHEHREVWLTGEAFFNIQKSSTQSKFVVQTDHLKVEVLGTSFNVNARRERTKVVLEEGSVRVMARRDTGAALALLNESGDFVESDGHHSDVVVGQVDHSLYTAWQDRKLKFENATVVEVLQSIDEFYGVTIRCADPDILERNFSGTLPNDNLDIVLRSLSNIYETTFESDHTEKRIRK